MTENLLSSIEYEYDANGRITSYKNEAGETIGYVYDPEGLLISLIYPGNKTVQYTYNGANQLETVTDWNNDVTTYGYNAIGELISTTRPNGTVETYTYYKNGWLKTKVDKDSSNNIISEFTYQYDNVGNIISEVGNGNNLTNDYNELYELNLQQNHDDQQTLIYELGYAYDVVGNITSESDENGITDTLTYGEGNKLATFNGNTIVYDNDNNMTSGPLDGTMSTYTYNQRNELMSVGNISVSYDSEGRRTSVTKGSLTTSFTVNPLSSYNQVLISEDDLGVKTYYVYGLGLISEEVNDTKAYYHFDRRGNTIALTDASEVITDTYEYDAYGAVLSRTGTSETPFRYVGQFGVSSDTDSLYFMMSRYYNVNIKRFINQDSLLGSISNALSTNQYAYLKGNPVNYVDPQGRESQYVENDGLATFIIMPSQSYGRTSKDLDKLDAVYNNAMDVIIGFTPLDFAIDLYSLKTGKSYFAGNEESRLWSAAYVLLPGIADNIISSSSRIMRASDEVIDGVKGTSEAAENLVYISKNADDVVQYVGITNNYARRAAEHLNQKGINIAPLMQNLSRSDARAVEQVLIEYHGLSKNGGTLINKINSISKKNKKYAESLERGLELLESIGYME